MPRRNKIINLTRSQAGILNRSISYVLQGIQEKGIRQTPENVWTVLQMVILENAKASECLTRQSLAGVKRELANTNSCVRRLCKDQVGLATKKNLFYRPYVGGVKHQNVAAALKHAA